MFVLRDGNSYVCQIDGLRYPFFNPTEKEQARLAAERRAHQIIVAQTEQGVPPNASLGDRQRLFRGGQ